MPAVTYIDPDSAKTSTAINTPLNDVTSSQSNNTGKTFIQKDGEVSMLAGNYTKAVNSAKIKWKKIPDIGREGDGITTFPVTAAGSEAIKRV